MAREYLPVAYAGAPLKLAVDIHSWISIAILSSIVIFIPEYITMKNSKYSVFHAHYLSQIIG